MSRLLVEEKIYYDDDESFGDQLELDDILKLKKKTQKEKRKKNKGITRRKKKLKVKSKATNIELTGSLTSILLIMLLLQVMRFGFGAVNSSTLRKTQNLLEVYLLDIDSWGALFGLHITFFELVLWNNTVPMWNGKSTLETYEHFRDYVEDSVIANFSRALDYDLGYYTDEYQHFMTKGNSCETVLRDLDGAENNCYLFNDGLFTGNLLNSLKGMVTSLEMQVEEWNQKKENWEDVKGMFKNPRFVFVIAAMQPVLYNYYYWTTTGCLKAYKYYSEKYIGLLKISLTSFFIFSIIILLLTLGVTFTQIKRSMGNVYSVLFITPMFLLHRNKFLSLRLRKVAKGKIEDVY